MQEAANKQKRITLKTLHEMLNGMSVELAEKVHLLFMANYIDYSDYDFRDENQVESYCWCYRDLFELKTKESQEIVNSQVIEFLDEWRQDAPSRYRKAKDDICYWITDEWYNFESPMQKEIESAYQTALKKKDDIAIALALSPFAQKTAELVNSGAYEVAAGSCYVIFRCLAKTCREHEDWFRGFTGYGDTYTKLAIFTESIVELYCHLRQMLDLSKRMADEMDINLEVFNLETDFFGDLHCSSRFTDMLCDAQTQYQDYSELENCPMWGMWEKEGRECDEGPTESRWGRWRINSAIESLSKRRKISITESSSTITKRAEMESLFNIVLKKKQEYSQITCNPTLGAMELDYCKILDSLVSVDDFVANRVDSCIKELELAGGIDFNGHYLTAFDAYNEAVTYYDLQQRGFKVHSIPETFSSTPDFEVEFTYRDWDGSQKTENVFLEVKSLAYANGNEEYKKAQESALESNIQLEEQRAKGRQFCSTEYCISPLGEKDTGPTAEIEEFNKKICNNIKSSQFKYGNGEDTILFVDMSQYMFPFKEKECLSVYPDVLRHYSASGRLWMIAFGIEGERIYSWPEFEGKGNFDRLLERPGILNCYDFIKGIIFCSGSEMSKRKLYGFHRYEEEDLKTATFLYQACDFVNDDKNTNGYKFFLELEEELKKRYGGA